MSAAASDDSAATLGGTAGSEEQEMHTEVVIRPKVRRPRSASTPRLDPQQARGNRAQDADFSIRAAEVGTDLGGAVLRVRIHTPPNAVRDRDKGEGGDAVGQGSTLRADKFPLPQPLSGLAIAGWKVHRPIGFPDRCEHL